MFARQKVWTVLFTVLSLACLHAEAAEKKKANIVILATGGTIAGAAATGRCTSSTRPGSRSQCFRWP